MDQTQEHRCASFGMKMSIVCALIGVAGPAGMFIKEFLQSLPGGPSAHSSDSPKWSILIATLVTVIAMSVAAAFLGRWAGNMICRRKSGIPGAILIGIGLAVTVMIVGVVLAVLCSIVVERSLDSVGVAGAFGVITVIVGALPAMLLGVLYGAVVRSRLAKVEGWSLQG